jgi:serine protease Do
MMLLKKEGDEVSFMGTVFLVHGAGYLITAAHILYSRDNLMVAPWEYYDLFAPMEEKTVTPYPVDVVIENGERDLALLKFQDKIQITAPDHIVGSPAETAVGSTTAYLGYPFGFYHIYAQVIRQATVCAKMKSRNGTNLFLIDSTVHDGCRGGPLVNADDGRVVGVIGSGFGPEEMKVKDYEKTSLFTSHISYAISIEYVEQMLENEGVEVV